MTIKTIEEELENELPEIMKFLREKYPHKNADKKIKLFIRKQIIKLLQTLNTRKEMPKEDGYYGTGKWIGRGEILKENKKWIEKCLIN